MLDGYSRLYESFCWTFFVSALHTAILVVYLTIAAMLNAEGIPTDQIPIHPPYATKIPPIPW